MRKMSNLSNGNNLHKMLYGNYLNADKYSYKESIVVEIHYFPFKVIKNNNKNIMLFCETTGKYLTNKSFDFNFNFLNNLFQLFKSIQRYAAYIGVCFFDLITLH